MALPWAAFTFMLYGFAFVGGLVKVWGRDYTPTLDHYAKAFAVERTADGLIWTGAAWNSFWTTVKLAAIAAPLTAALGLIAAWLLVRQRFAGRATLEFATMLSFAVPGTVIGVAYVFAFNVPPIEITGTALIIVLCFVFRNMPVGVRAGMAAMSQIDRSLDEASLTLRGRAPQTLVYVVLPLLRPAIVGALVYGFVRAVTTVSAVVFLVTAEYELATTYIILRVINGDYGLAIAYSCALIVLMLAVILLIQFAVGERRLGRRAVALAGRPRMSVEFQNVVKRYGEATAVAGVSFTVEAGTLVTLLGPSGCGKTTTLRMIAGLELPSEGRILIAGRDVTDLGATERDVSMVFQSYALFPHMSVLENVCYGLRRSGSPRTTRPAQAREGLLQVGLEGYEERQPSELSGGQQQRVAVARALVLKPSVLLFDEPLSNLDARLRRQMREEIRELQQRLGLTVVYVTHDQQEAMAVSDRIIVMNAGRIEQQGAPARSLRAAGDALPRALHGRVQSGARHRAPPRSGDACA